MQLRLTAGGAESKGHDHQAWTARALAAFPSVSCPLVYHMTLLEAENYPLRRLYL